MSTKRHTIYNIAGATVPVALLTIPLYLKTIGDIRYGVLMLAWVLLGNFGLFDLGLGRALAQRIAALRKSSPEDRAAVFWTAVASNAVLGAVGGLILIPVAGFFFSTMASIPPEIRGEISGASLWLALAVPIATISGALTGALQGDARFLRLNASSIFGTVLFQVLPLLAALSGHIELSVLMPVVILARILAMVSLMLACRDYLMSFRQAAWSRGELGTMLRAGGWISLTTLFSPMVLAADRVAIGALSGTAMVTNYGVPYQLGEKSTIFSYAMASALFPRFATANSSEASRLAREGQRLIAIVMTPTIITVIIVLEPFLAWWVSGDFAESAAPAGQVLLAGFWLSGFSKIPHLQLQAIGRPDLVAKALLLQVVPYGLALYFAITAFGIVGAAMAFAAKAALDSAMLAWLTNELGATVRLLAMPVLLMSVISVSSVALLSEVETRIALSAVFAGAVAWSWSKTPKAYKDMASDSFARALQRVARK